MRDCLGLGLSLQQNEVIVVGNNAIPLIRQLIELSEIVLKALALFSKRLKQALIEDIGRNPLNQNGLAVLVLTMVAVRKSNQNFAIGQVVNKACGGRNTAAVWNGLL